jgi:hypothetical protein
VSAFVCLVIAACSHTDHAPTPAAATAPIYAEIDWKDLIPADEIENYHLAVAFSMRNIDHNSEQRAAQFGSFKTVAALEGRAVALPGYVVPLDTDDQGRMSAFFFMPTMGACIHVPPPPPDQMIFVQLSQPIAAPEIGDSRWLRGVLHTQTHDGELASAAYAMQDAELAPRPLDAG